MSKILRIAALIVVVVAIGFWVLKGAHPGWTKSKVEVVTLDPVTTLEKRTWEDTFVPGMDFLGAALMGAGILAGISLLIRNKKMEHPHTDHHT
jgi:hypothetical protein